IDGVYRGRITVADRLKPDAARAVDALRGAGVRKVTMLTGDARPIADAVAGQLGLDEVYAELLPADKVEIVEKLLAETSGNVKLVFVGDGINDAPALARADVGIAMGGLGSDAAIEAADVVIMTDEPLRVAAAVSIARRTMAIVRQNIGLALGVKAAVMALGAVGAASMWAAVFADVGVAVLAILNAIRALRIQRMP
ncbi:MAG: HAD-IC family P-type ATPase, partial [Clostridiales bacterium]|nr:HAD-IC family P-type ATPase [Clostridiales bacterium]